MLVRRSLRMTIDSGWVKILKTSVPDAFTHTLPRPASTVFVDGQIKLMKADYIRTWQQFFENQFVHTVEKAFESGASVVVMGFDDYTYVPVCKNMTQTKRNKSVPNEHDDLPSTIPENWSGAIRNRTCKIKVIGFVIRNLKLRYKHETRRSVVVDFAGTPESSVAASCCRRSSQPRGHPCAAASATSRARSGWTTAGRCCSNPPMGTFCPSP